MLIRSQVFVFLILTLLLPKAFAAPASPASGEWKSEKLGNIFVPGDLVALSFVADADTAIWQITDFWHKEISRGSATFAGGQAVVQPKIATIGYYLVHLTPTKGGAELRDSYTSFAIVRPHLSKDSLHSPFGVMTHFSQGMKPEMLPVFKKIGIESIRDEHYWGQVEKTAGQYQFNDRSLAYMKACQDVGINPLIPMTFGNKLYDSEKGPSTPAGYAGYANYGAALLDQFGKQIHWLEIWNEYNGSWSPEAARNDRPKFYTEMLKAAYTRIKEARSDVQVLGGAAVLIPLPYFEGIFKLDGLKYMDGVVIHPYRARPEGVDREVEALQALIRQYNGGKDKPIWVTETGRFTSDEYDWEAGRKMFEKGRAEGARYLPRQYTLLLKQKVEKIYWYLASDHQNFVSMGLLRNHDKEASGMGRYAVAPAYVSYANLIEQLDGATYVKREAIRDYTRAQVQLFRRGDEEIRVCWATQPSKIRVKAGQPLALVNIMGAESTVVLNHGEATLDLNEDTIYLKGKVSEVGEVETGARILAGSSDDYSKTQGENNWYYGYYVDGNFRELEQVETMWGYKWGIAGKFLSIWQDGMHPDRAAGKETPTVLRWKSPVAGSLRVKGFWENSGKGDGITGGIAVDGKEVASQPAGGASPKRAPVDTVITVKAGSFVDFVCHPNANINFDATTREFVIFQEK